MNIFITASTSNSAYSCARHINVWSAKHIAKFDKVIAYDVDKDMDLVFREKNKKILSQPKGAGLWLWKAYFIKKAYDEECKEGDVLFYLDALAFFIKKVSFVIDSMSDDIFASLVPYKESSYTKREALQALDMDIPEVIETRQFQASFMAFRKSKRSTDFLNFWYDLVQDYDLISTDWNPTVQYQSFKDHRYDQSLFSLTCKKFNVEPHDDPTCQGKVGYPYFDGASYMGIKRKNEYPSCIFLHRTRGNYINIWKRMIVRDLNRNRLIKNQISSGLITYCD